MSGRRGKARQGIERSLGSIVPVLRPASRRPGAPRRLRGAQAPGSARTQPSRVESVRRQGAF